mmetsp:Transcript_4263/g.11038  ORF Transcript_4263/g.11038 Transcript_4263/m.11038 type:complete len:318 (-) Transcript_4263:3-956(-)
MPVGSERCTSPACAAEAMSGRTSGSPNAKHPAQSSDSIDGGSASRQPKSVSDQDTSRARSAGQRRSSQRAPARESPSMWHSCSSHNVSETVANVRSDAVTSASSSAPAELSCSAGALDPSSRGGGGTSALPEHWRRASARKRVQRRAMCTTSARSASDGCSSSSGPRSHASAPPRRTPLKHKARTCGVRSRRRSRSATSTSPSVFVPDLSTRNASAVTTGSVESPCVLTCARTESPSLPPGDSTTMCVIVVQHARAAAHHDTHTSEAGLQAPGPAAESTCTSTSCGSGGTDGLDASSSISPAIKGGWPPGGARPGRA